jgi:hypothetical protein
MKKQILSIWLSEEEQKEIMKLRKKADEERRTLSNYCKKVLFEVAEE